MANVHAKLADLWLCLLILSHNNRDHEVDFNGSKLVSIAQNELSQALDIMLVITSYRLCEGV